MMLLKSTSLVVLLCRFQSWSNYANPTKLLYFICFGTHFVVFTSISRAGLDEIHSNTSNLQLPLSA